MQTRCQIASDQSGRYRRKCPGKSRPIFHGAAQTNGVAASLMAPICAAVKSFNRNRTPTKETLFLSPRGQRLRKTSWRMRPCIFFFHPPFCAPSDRAAILAGKSISLLVFWWNSGRENRQPLTEAFCVSLTETRMWCRDWTLNWCPRGHRSNKLLKNWLIQNHQYD